MKNNTTELREQIRHYLMATAQHGAGLAILKYDGWEKSL